MGKYGIKIGCTIFYKGNFYLVVRVKKKKVTLLLPATGIAHTIPMHEYKKLLLRIFTYDECWRFVIDDDQDQLEQYRKALVNYVEMVKNSFHQYFTKKEWKAPKDFSGLWYACTTVPQPGLSQEYRDLFASTLRRCRKYNTLPTTVTENISDFYSEK